MQPQYLSSDETDYKEASPEEQMMMEIPVRLVFGKRFFTIESQGKKPVILPDDAYTKDKGLDMAKAQERIQDLYFI